MSEAHRSRWQEVGETLSDLLAWLEESKQWAAATAGLGELSDAATSPAYGEGAAEAASPDMFALLAALTALRQEVKLQTRASRQDREQAAGALEQLSAAVGLLERRRREDAARYQAELQQANRATIETLVELHDALSRAARQAGSIVEAASATLHGWSQIEETWDNRQGGGQLPMRIASHPSKASRVEASVGARLWGWLWRWARRVAGEFAPGAGREPPSYADGRDARLELRRIQSEAASLADRLEGLTTGYMLSVQRLERVLAAYDIEPMACLGHSVDAERMEVVQVVADPAQPPGIVMDEVRRGYLQGGRVYRFAQVVATRSSRQNGDVLPAATHEDPPA